MTRRTDYYGNAVTWKDEQIYSNGLEYHSECIINDLELKIGNFVLVSNHDEPDTVKALDVVEILQFYEIIDPLSPDYRYQAVVQSYKRISALSEEIVNLVPDADYDREVVLSPVSYTCSLPLYTIRSICIVMFCEPDLLTVSKNEQNVYICRYKIINKNGKLSLVAIKGQHANNAFETTPSKKIVSPIKILNQNSIQKVSKLSQRDIENVLSESDYETDESSSNVFRSKESRTNSSGARRNLNSSLNDVADNMLVGSIVESPYRRKSELKMTIKVTRKEGLSAHIENVNSPTPLKQIQCDYQENINKKSTTKRNARSDSPLPNTPTKSPKRNDGRYELESPNENMNITNTPRGILKPMVHLKKHADTPRRSIKFDLKEQPKRSQQNTETPPKEKPENISTSPITPSLKRSARISSIHRMNLAESPLDDWITDLPDESVRNKSRKTPKKTPKKSPKNTPINAVNRTPRRTPSRRNVTDTSFDESLEDSSKSLDDTFEIQPKKSQKTPIKTPRKTPSQTPKKTPSSHIKMSEANLQKRKTPICKERPEVELAKESLHVSAVPKSLPCRESEFNDIYSFIEGKILDQSGGCMYVSGVPGTGKTATFTEVIRCLQLKVKRKKLPEFEFIEINGMRLTEPRQAYVQIYRQLMGVTVTWEQAQSMLEKRFRTPTINRKTTVLLVDEFDLLCNRRQDVVYNLLDWPTKKAAQLIVVTIANTMDLPERFLMGRVSSRLGLTRLTFQPYSHKQLNEVVLARLTGTNIFNSDAIQLVARKVASISGDCRRALDICRRATEIAELDCAGKNVMVSMSHVQTAFNEMITNPKVLAVRDCSKYEQLFLQAVEAEIARTGVDETNLCQVYQQYESICALNGVNVPDPVTALRISSRLGSSRLLICEHSGTGIHQKIMLNISQDDIYYALHTRKND